MSERFIQVNGVDDKDITPPKSAKKIDNEKLQNVLQIIHESMGRRRG